MLPEPVIFYMYPYLKINSLPSYTGSNHYFVCFAVVFPVQKPAVTNSSSSEDEAGRNAGTVIRRRRVRKNTTSIATEPDEEEEALESGLSEEEEEEEEVKEDKQQKEQAEVRPDSALDVRMQGQGSSILNKCILLALIVAISMGFGHFYGKKFTTALEDITVIIVYVENILTLKFLQLAEMNVHIFYRQKIYKSAPLSSLKDHVISICL